MQDEPQPIVLSSRDLLIWRGYRAIWGAGGTEPGSSQPQRT